MKKPILYGALGLTLAVVAAAAATPLVIGNGVRDATMNGVLELLPPESRNQLQITETRFDSGWFSSQGELDVRYAAFAEQDNLSVRLLFDIAHGPILSTPDGWRLGLAYAEIVPSFSSTELTQAMSELPYELPEVHIDLFADLDQSLEMTLSIAPFNFSEEAAQISFAGLDGSVMTNPDLSAKVLLSMGELQATQPTTQMGFTLAGLELESTTEQINVMLAPSMVMLAIPAISSAYPYPFTVSNISADSRVQPSSAGQEQIDIHQGFRIANIETDIPVTSLNLTMDVNEFPSDLIRSYTNMMQDIQNAMSNNSAAGLNPVDEYAEEMVTIAARSSLVFNYLIEANAFEGDHSMNLNIDWRGLPDVTDLDSIEAMQILEVFSFALNLSLDEAAVARSPIAELVDPYVQQGYLRIESGRILMDASLSDAALTVNGETVSLEQFL